MKAKKILVLLMVCLLFGSVNVWADEGWVPKDAFYEDNVEKCIYHNRAYTANGPNGKVIVYESPASAREIQELENGKKVVIDYIYTNDKNVSWGYCESGGKKGWLPMPYMTLVYDYLLFAEDYKEQIQEETGEITREQLFWENRLDDMDFKFWSYPGSESKFTIYMGTYDGMGWLKYTSTFIDEQGRKWGFIPRWGGDTINRWICLDYLTLQFEELYPEGTPERGNQVAAEEYDGEEIFPDNYEEVQMQKMIKKGMAIVTMTVGIVLVMVVVICLKKRYVQRASRI